MELVENKRVKKNEEKKVELNESFSFGSFRMDNNSIEVIRLSLGLLRDTIHGIEMFTDDEKKYIYPSCIDMITAFTKMQKDYKFHEIISTDNPLSEED